MLSRDNISAILKLWITSMACCFMSSCNVIWSDEGLNSQCPERVRQTVTLNLTISHPDASISTRASLEYDDLSFTRNEAAVKSLTAFLVDLDQNGNEIYGDGKVKHFSTKLDPVDFYNGIYIFRQTIEAETGTKRIYVGANLREEHIDAFIQNKAITSEGDGPAVNMVMTPDPKHSGQGTDIAMFGQIKMRDGSEDITINENVTDYYLAGELERLTAKVLLTCADEDGFVPTGKTGWVETGKIRYTLNTTNRKTFINKRQDDTHNINIDPNWNLGDWVGNDPEFTDSYIPINDYGNQFEYWETDELMTRLFDERYSTIPMVYDTDKIGEGNSENHYTEGLYCLENTTVCDLSITGADKDNAAKVGTTHVIIAVRYIPRYFVGGWNDNTDAETYSRALSTIFIPGDDNGSGAYSAGTYWTREVDGEIIYYAWTGVKRKIRETANTANPLKESDFTCYEGGWSYFTTFIDGDLSGTQLTYANKAAWGVQRDYYYILAIDKISKPGSPMPWDEFIRVNSITTDWVHKGSKDVIVSPI